MTTLGTHPSSPSEKRWEGWLLPLDFGAGSLLPGLAGDRLLTQELTEAALKILHSASPGGRLKEDLRTHRGSSSQLVDPGVQS